MICFQISLSVSPVSPFTKSQKNNVSEHESHDDKSNVPPYVTTNNYSDVFESGAWSNFSIKTDPATHTESFTGLRIHSSKAKSSQFTVEVFKTPFPPITLCVPCFCSLSPCISRYHSLRYSDWADICSHCLSHRRGPAVGVLVVVFSERAALEKLPL